LKGSPNTDLTNLVGLEAGYILTLKIDASAGQRVIVAYEVKNGRFAGTVGANQAKNFTLPDSEAYIIYGGQPTEIFHKILNFKQSQAVTPE
jgi:hypothetical protein